ncbi:unnamed protein product, partial [Allacma fusca]
MSIFNFVGVILSLCLFHFCSSGWYVTASKSLPSACANPVKVGSCRGKVP